MDKKESNMKNKEKQNSPRVPEKKGVENTDDLNELVVEGACSPEFSEGCKPIDDEAEK